MVFKTNNQNCDLMEYKQLAYIILYSNNLYNQTLYSERDL